MSPARAGLVFHYHGGVIHRRHATIHDTHIPALQVARGSWLEVIEFDFKHLGIKFDCWVNFLDVHFKTGFSCSLKITLIASISDAFMD